MNSETKNKSHKAEAKVLRRNLLNLLSLYGLVLRLYLLYTD
jgi:hypothetical protein